MQVQIWVSFNVPLKILSQEPYINILHSCLRRQWGSKRVDLNRLAMCIFILTCSTFRVCASQCNLILMGGPKGRLTKIPLSSVCINVTQAKTPAIIIISASVGLGFLFSMAQRLKLTSFSSTTWQGIYFLVSKLLIESNETVRDGDLSLRRNVSSQ